MHDDEGPVKQEPEDSKDAVYLDDTSTYMKSFMAEGFSGEQHFIDIPSQSDAVVSAADVIHNCFNMGC